MRNLPRPFLVIGLVTTLLLSTVTVAAQGTANDWSKVTALASGSNLSVRLKSGKTINGTLSSASDNMLSVTSKKAPVEIKREDVRSVYEVVKNSSAAKATLIGAGVGAGAGALLGAIVDASNDDGFEKIDNAATAVLAVGGAGVGALVGYLIGRSRSKRVLVYEAK